MTKHKEERFERVVEQPEAFGMRTMFISAVIIAIVTTMLMINNTISLMIGWLICIPDSIILSIILVQYIDRKVYYRRIK